MTKFSESQTVRTQDRERDLVPTREEVEQSRKLVEEIRKESKPDSGQQFKPANSD